MSFLRNCFGDLGLWGTLSRDILQRQLIFWFEKKIYILVDMFEKAGQSFVLKFTYLELKKSRLRKKIFKIYWKNMAKKYPHFSRIFLFSYLITYNKTAEIRKLKRPFWLFFRNSGGGGQTSYHGNVRYSALQLGQNL